jgi:hypothetical protein
VLLIHKDLGYIQVSMQRPFDYKKGSITKFKKKKGKWWVGCEKFKCFKSLFDNAWMHPSKELATKGATVVATHCKDPTGSDSNS